MRAVVITRYGDAETLQLADVPRPEPAAGEVLVRVHAAGINPIDWKIRVGQLRFFMPLRLPRTPGFDCSGEVVEVGQGVDDFQPGDEVFCFSNRFPGGCYAEYARVASWACARKPASVDHQHAAGTPLAALTALQCLRDNGRLQAGQDVLVNGASGGVGTFAVQIAKALGARVTGVCSEKNIDLVRQLGADDVIDYRRNDFTRADRRWHIVLDAVANRSFWSCRGVLTPHGRYVNTLPYPKHLLAHAATLAGALTLLGRRRAYTMWARPNHDDLRQMAQWIDEGQVRPVLDEVFPLEEAAAAHRKSEGGHVRGKVVLNVIQ